MDLLGRVPAVDVSPSGAVRLMGRSGVVIQVDGQPTVTTKVGFLPPPYFEATTLEEFMDLGHIMTAVPAINGIAAVVAAAPGIATYADLPLTLPRGFAKTS